MSQSAQDLHYKRLLLKMSGEALVGDGEYGIDLTVVERLAGDVASAVKAGAELAIVLGGGGF